ncbi:hypothetical protein APHAL10511_007098 [Amanita phalloides]|nr:hypothetical protein APHAL10511_007098 [Amanita phalloides]
MQAATRLHTSAYHSPYQQGLQDCDLKRQYLALLPPQQIIDICLAFDVHVPHYIKSTVWPLDINAAIAALNKTHRPSDSTSSTAKTNNVPVMDSLRDPQAQSPSSTQSPAHNSYPYPSQAAYPHAPYYPAGYPPYSHLYPGYPPPGYPPHPLLASGSTPQPQDSYGTQSTDELPSYEEMIVEALAESNDPEGCAPKDLFTWMASRYPLQSNFRPSASQALQKAYKRGRFEKTSGGKYKLNTAWEGGNTSRRTTRRPQTQTQTTAPSSSTLTPPFTQTPLVHHHSHQPGLRPPYPSTSSGYTQLLQASAQPPSAGSIHGSSDKDAYETAQNILKAINFGGLLRLSNENGEGNINVLDSTTAEGAAAPSTEMSKVSPGVPPKIQSGKGTTTSETVTLNKDPTASRAELQARLVLLAAQLGEIARDEPLEQGVGEKLHTGVDASVSMAAPASEEDDNDEEMEAVI